MSIFDSREDRNRGRSRQFNPAWSSPSGGGFNPALESFIIPLNFVSGSTQVNTAMAVGTGSPTFTRATVAWTKKENGLWAQVGSGVPRSSFIGMNTAVGEYGGYLQEGAGTQLVTPTASIRDMTDASWVKTNMTTAKTSTGIDGVGSSCTRLTASLAGANIYQELVGAATSRTYSSWIKRITGTGTIALSQGTTTGSEILTNGTFTTDAAGWTGINATLASVAGQLVMTATAGSPYAYQAITTVAGTFYRFTATLVADAMTGNNFMYAGTTSSVIDLSNRNLSSVPGTYSTIFQATGTTTYIKVSGASAALAAETSTWDNISVMEAVVLDVTALINSATFTQVQYNATQLHAQLGTLIATSGDAIDVDFNQFEAGGFATSPMDAAGAARDTDVLTYPASGNVDASSGTCYAELSTLWSLWSTVGASAYAINVSGNARLLYNSEGASTVISMYDSATAVSKAGLLAMATGVRKRASSWGATGQSITGDGASPGTGLFDGAMGLGATINIGVVWYGYIKNIRIWKTQLPDATLQTLTA